MQGAKKVIFTACQPGKLKLAFTSPNIISTSPPPPQILWWAELISHFFCKLNPSKYFNCPSGKLRTEFTSPKPKSTSPGLLDTSFLSHTFFACWYVVHSVNIRVKTIGQMLSYQGKKWKILQTVIQKSAGGLLQGVVDDKSF